MKVVNTSTSVEVASSNSENNPFEMLKFTTGSQQAIYRVTVDREDNNDPDCLNKLYVVCDGEIIMKNRITSALFGLIILMMYGCGSGKDETSVLSEVVYADLLHDSHYTIGANYGVDSKYNYIDTNGSVSHVNGSLGNGDYGTDATIVDFNQSDVALFRLVSSGAEDKGYYITKLTEYDSYVEMAGEEWLSISGGSEVVSHFGAWVEIPKYDKPLMYNERIQYIDYETQEQLYERNPTKTLAEKGEAVPYALLAEGSVEVSGRIGKHYELVRSAGRLATLYEKAGLDAEGAYAVDFGTHNVLALFMGSVDTPEAAISLTALNYIGGEYASKVGGDSTYKLAEVDNAIAPSSCGSEKRYLPYQFLTVPDSWRRDDIAFVDTVRAVECR